MGSPVDKGFIGFSSALQKCKHNTGVCIITFIKDVAVRASKMALKLTAKTVEKKR